MTYDFTNLFFVVINHFKKTTTVYDHLIKLKRKHFLMIYLPLVLSIVVINKIMHYT